MKFHLCWKKAVLLAVAALLILAPAAIAAESVEGENLKMESLKTSVKVGGTVTVSLGLNEVTADSVTGGIKFDTNLMECTAITGPNGEELSDFMVTGDVDKANPPHVFYKTYSSLDSDDVNTTGIVGFAYAGLIADSYSEETVLKATFKAKATGEATFVLFEDTSYDYAAGSGYQNDASATAKTTITEGGMTVSVSGTALSWDDKDNAAYLLYKADTEDDVIASEWQNDTYATSDNVLYIGTGAGAVAKTVDGKSMKAQEFGFDEVEDGSYKLAVCKAGKYVPKIVAVEVEGDDVAFGDVKLWLYGDVNYDGKVLANDALQINRKVNSKSSIFDNGDAETKADREEAADINGDGKILANDALQINRYVNSKSSMFGNFK